MIKIKNNKTRTRTEVMTLLQKQNDGKIDNTILQLFNINAFEVEDIKKYPNFKIELKQYVNDFMELECLDDKINKDDKNPKLLKKYLYLFYITCVQNGIQYIKI